MDSNVFVEREITKNQRGITNQPWEISEQSEISKSCH